MRFRVSVSGDAMRIVCEQIEPNHWTAWFTNQPETAYDGASPLRAVVRLLDHTPGVDARSLVPDSSRTRDGHLEFVLNRECPDCRGTGEYIGLCEVSPCKTCGGSGRVTCN